MQTESYSKLFSIINEDASKEMRYSVSLETEYNFSEKLYSAPSGQYQDMYGGDLSTIFAPWRSGPEGNFETPPATGLVVGQHPLYPFRYDPSASGQLYNIQIASGMDSMQSLVSSDEYYLGPDLQRDLTDTRGVGLRGPVIIVGWGYDSDDNPVPSGQGSGLFKGEHEHGYNVDPKDYIAAPLDVKYDHDTKTWRAAGGLPPGGENFMVLQKQNGTAKWDWTRAATLGLEDVL